MAIFEGKKSSNDIRNNDTMSDDEVVASYVPPRYLFLKRKIVIWTNMIPVFSQKHGAMLNFYQIFLFYHWIIIQKSRMNIMNTQDMKSTKKELQFETNLTSVALTV